MQTYLVSVTRRFQGHLERGFLDNEMQDLYEGEVLTRNNAEDMSRFEWLPSDLGALEHLEGAAVIIILLPYPKDGRIPHLPRMS